MRTSLGLASEGFIPRSTLYIATTGLVGVSAVEEVTEHRPTNGFSIWRSIGPEYLYMQPYSVVCASAVSSTLTSKEAIAIELGPIYEELSMAAMVDARSWTYAYVDEIEHLNIALSIHTRCKCYARLTTTALYKAPLDLGLLDALV